VVWIAEGFSGLGDQEVLAMARELERVLLTHDLGFGDLVFRDHLLPPPAVVLMRLPSRMDFSVMGRIVAAALDSHDRWLGNFAVVRENVLRFTALPTREPPEEL